MPKSRIAGIGMYVPEQVMTNDDLTQYMDTSDAWIQERTGIKERRYADRTGETTATMGVEAAKMAIERAASPRRILTSLCLPHFRPTIIFQDVACWYSVL